MDAIRVTRRALNLPLRFIGGVVATLALALSIIYVMMQPPVSEFAPLALFLSLTATISIAVGFGAYRLGWIRQAPHVSWMVLGGYLLSSGLTFVNVWVTARLMFASQHDLLLATVLLLFATGIAASLGYFLSMALTDRMVVLSQAAQDIARGRLSARVPVSGRDEMASLAQTFNEMAQQLEVAAEQQRELDHLRRNLIAWVGHDLRTPLASIRAIVEALADGVVEDSDTVQRYLRTAQREIRSLSQLIDDLFHLAQLEAGGVPLERSPNSISDLISDTMESFAQLALRREVTVRGSAAPGVDPVFMDTKQIGRVLSNLVGNALRHTPPGGVVEVRAVRTATGVRVDVHDSGEGIPADDVPHIFERFYRGEKSRNRTTGGAGLGLAIAKAIVEAHGGCIDVYSAVGEGTRFYFVLPVV
jgi:signal transduction histidine kinase